MHEYRRLKGYFLWQTRVNQDYDTIRIIRFRPLWGTAGQKSVFSEFFVPDAQRRETRTRPYIPAQKELLSELDDCGIPFLLDRCLVLP